MSKKNHKDKRSKGSDMAAADGGGASDASVPDEGLAKASISREDYDAQLLILPPWHIVLADDKRLARLNLMRDILSRLHYAGKKNKLVQPDADIAFEFTPDCIAAKRLAR